MKYLVINLKKLHSGNAYILSKVNAAKDLLKNPEQLLRSKDLSTLIELVADIFEVPGYGDEIAHKHSQLLKESREIANVIYAKMSLSSL